LLAALPPDPLVLDVGCGDGARTLANLPAGAIGLDFARQGLSLASETVPDSRLLQAEMTAIPLAEGLVDAVTAYHAVFHVPRERHPAVYQEFARVLRPGGTLLVHGYRPEQVDYGTGGPPIRENMYTEELLAEAFGDLEIEVLQSYDAEIAEGTGHLGMSALIDLVATKPA